MDDVIRRYIERALELSNSHEAALTEDELATIAREIGLSDADFALIEKAIEDSAVRGRGYLARAMWDDAVREFEEAAALAPARTAVQLELAGALLERAGAEDRRRAEAIARQALNVDPGCSEAFEVLAKLSPPKQRATGRAPMWALAGAAVVAAAGLAASLLAGTPSPVTLTPPAPPAVVEPNSSATPAPASVEPESGEVELPIVWDAGAEKDVEFRSRRSVLANYPQSSFYTLWGELRVTGDIELEQLAVRVQLLDADGVVLSTEQMDGWPTHQARLRKGDRGIFTLLHAADRRAKSVRVAPGIVKKVPAAGPYDAARVIEPVWATKPPGHLQVEVRERHSSFSVGSFLKRGTFEATWEVANVGKVPIRKLAYVVNVYDKSGQLLESRKKLATFASNPPIEPGEVLIESTIAIMESTDYGRYELEILQVE